MTKFTIPQEMPARRIFVQEMLTAVFPEHHDVPKNRYYNLCNDAVLQFDSSTQLCEGDLFRFMYELNKFTKQYFHTMGKPLQSEASFKAFAYDEVKRFYDANNGVLSGWLTDATGKTNLYYSTAAFFGYLLLTRAECADTRKDFLYRCLGYLGVTDWPDIIHSKLSAFDWQALSETTDNCFGQSFHRLTNPAILTLGSALVTVLKIMGTDTTNETEVQRAQQAIQGFHAYFHTLFHRDELLGDSLQAAENRLWQCMRYFEPRSIHTAHNRLSPQDFFVVPSFHNEQDEEVNPSALLCHDERSRRCLIVGNTGQGKSLYIQLFIFCMLYRRYNPDNREEDRKKVGAIRQKLQVTEDKYILSIPARMFSSCYLNERYKAWTEDFVTLYFNCMWQFPNENFFSLPNQMSRLDHDLSAPVQTYEVTPFLKEYLRSLAQSGRLILLLDSYDEIVSGEMRLAYNAALSRFYQEYGHCLRTNESGAHILVSTRRMSPNTMQRLCSAMAVSAQDNLFRIQPLSLSNIRQLVQNWNTGYYHKTQAETERLLYQVENNHFCHHYAVNPYMLSVMCSEMGKGFDEIMRSYTKTLSELMHDKTRLEPMEIQGVLISMQDILEDIAGETVLNHQSSFSRSRLESYLRRQLKDNLLTDKKVDAYIERLHEIFATVIGLIIPADGSDEDYQFINEQIRFELAAKHFQRCITKQGDLSVLPTKNVSEYVGCMVPLICGIKDDYALAEKLVYHLTLFECDVREENELLTAILDLLLKRYSSSSATVMSPGTYVEPYIRRSQRLLLMRLMTAERFVMTDAEKEAFRQCNAYKSNKDWFGTT